MKLMKVMKRIISQTKGSRRSPGTYEDTVTFPDKVAKGREMLKNRTLPPELLSRRVKN